MVGHRRTAVLGAMSFIAMVLSVASCGGGSGGATGTAGTGGGTPGADCNEVIKTACNRTSVECANGADAGVNAEADCNKVLQVVIGCERATSSFADCLKDTKAISCSSLSAGLPPSCDEPRSKVPLSPAQMKCNELGLAACSWDARCAGVTPQPDALLACQQDFFFDLDCIFAESVNEQCTADLPTASCGAADAGTAPLPPSCNGAITYIPE